MSKNRKKYCRHCNEYIVYQDGRWRVFTKIRYNGRFGDPDLCRENEEETGHDPR